MINETLSNPLDWKPGGNMGVCWVCKEPSRPVEKRYIREKGVWGESKHNVCWPCRQALGTGNTKDD